jgi:hypothetical protein
VTSGGQTKLKIVAQRFGAALRGEEILNHGMGKKLARVSSSPRLVVLVAPNCDSFLSCCAIDFCTCVAETINSFAGDYLLCFNPGDEFLFDCSSSWEHHTVCEL